MSQRRVVLLSLLAAVAALKLAILAAVGPSRSPDSGFYIVYADQILDGSALGPLPWGPGAITGFAFRTVGYPLLLALAKLVAPGWWAALSIVLQSALDLVVMALMFAVAERLTRSIGWAAVAVLVYALSRSLLWDNSLLSDSLYASLFNIVIFALLGDRLGCWRLSPLSIVGLAVMWGYSLWTRDNGLYFTFLPLILQLAGPGRADWRHLVPAAGFAAVVAAMVGGYTLFNLNRTGEAFFSLTGIQNYLRPLFDMKAYGYADPFSGDDLISRTVRETMTRYDYPAQTQFIDTLDQRCDCTPTRLQALIFGKFTEEVAQHPSAYLRVIMRNFDYFDLASDLTDPINTFNDFLEEGTGYGARLIPGLSLRHLAVWRSYAPSMVVLMFVAGITKLLSTVLFTLFVVGIPVLWLQQWRRGAPVVAETWAAVFLWLAFISITAAFSLIHFEPRHALPVFPAAQFGIVNMLSVVAAWRRRCGYGRLPQVKIEVKP
jgi:hypothetical protein